jgi:hypothetical protein
MEVVLEVGVFYCPDCGHPCDVVECSCVDDCPTHGTPVGKALAAVRDASVGRIDIEQLEWAYHVLRKAVYGNGETR